MRIDARLRTRTVEGAMINDSSMGQPTRSHRPRVALAISWIVTALVFIGAGYCLMGAIREGTATRKANAGQGQPGTFLAETWRCPKACSWHGTFTADGRDRGNVQNIELRGADEDSIEAGRRVRVLNVGPFVQAENGSPEWGTTTNSSIGTFFFTLLGVAMLFSSLATQSRSRTLKS
jgi:hypothetical protein